MQAIYLIVVEFDTTPSVNKHFAELVSCGVRNASETHAGYDFAADGRVHERAVGTPQAERACHTAEDDAGGRKAF